MHSNVHSHRCWYNRQGLLLNPLFNKRQSSFNDDGKLHVSFSKKNLKNSTIASGEIKMYMNLYVYISFKKGIQTIDNSIRNRTVLFAVADIDISDDPREEGQFYVAKEAGKLKKKLFYCTIIIIIQYYPFITLSTRRVRRSHYRESLQLDILVSIIYCV